MLISTFSYCLNFNSKYKYTATNNSNLFEGVFMTDSIVRIGIIAIAFIILGLAVLNLAGFFEEKPWSPIMTSGNTISLNALRGENGTTQVLEVTPTSAVPVVSHTPIGPPPSDVQHTFTQMTGFSGIQDISGTVPVVSHTPIGPPPSDAPQHTFPQTNEFSGVQAISTTQNGISPTYEAVIPAYPVSINGIPVGTSYEAVSINGIPVGTSYEAVSINGIPVGTGYEAVSINGIPVGTGYEAVSINGIPVSQSVSVASSQGSSSSSVSRK